MPYTVYLITNKVYVGYTKHSIEKRWNQHCKKAMKEILNTPFYNAIRKYGIDVWRSSILETCESAEKAKSQEIHYIQQFNSYKEGYNATLGGDGNNGIVMSEESNKKRSEALKGIAKNYNRMHGKRHSSETIQKMKNQKQTRMHIRLTHLKKK